MYRYSNGQISLADFAYAAAKLHPDRPGPTPWPLKSDTLFGGPTVGIFSVETGLFVSLHAVWLSP